MNTSYRQFKQKYMVTHNYKIYYLYRIIAMTTCMCLHNKIQCENDKYNKETKLFLMHTGKRATKKMWHNTNSKFKRAFPPRVN